MGTPLADSIRQNKNRICKTLHVGYANWDDLLHRVERQERITERENLEDEQVWTFLVSCAFSIAGKQGAGRLAQILTEAPSPRKTTVWFEVLPLPPRSREGNTHLDLALGSIALRNGTQSGIELSDEEPSWVCFVECKWYSDIAVSVSYDKHRNQLARVIENALYFHQGNRFAQEVHVTLVTPEVFRTSQSSSRLYCYKYAEYQNSEEKIANLLKDLSASRLPPLQNFPELQERLPTMQLHWITYETLFVQIPDSEMKRPFLQFVKKFNGAKE